MIYEDLEGQEPPEKDFKLPTSDLCQVCSSLTVFQKFDFRRLLLVSLDITTKHKLLVFFGFCFSGLKVMRNTLSILSCFLVFLYLQKNGRILQWTCMCMPLIQNNQLLTFSHLYIFFVPPWLLFSCIIWKGRADILTWHPNTLSFISCKYIFLYISILLSNFDTVM